MKKFKSLLFILIVLFTFILTGCSDIFDFSQDKDDDKQQEQTDVPEYVVVLFDGSNATNVEKGKTVKSIDAETKEGYDFLYWTLNDKEYDFNTPVNENINLISKYQKKTFTVTFDIDGEKTEEKVEYGEKVSEPQEPNVSGKEFAGWFYNDVEYDFNSLVKDNITIYAKFDDQVFNVNFIVDGSTTTKKVLFNAVITPEDAVKEGYTFKGWFVGNTAYDFSKPIKQDVTVEAKFEKNTYTVRFINSVTKAESTVTVEYGEKVKKPSDPVATGYTFKGYECEGKEFDFNTAIKSNIEIYETFTVKTLTVTFMVDGSKVSEKTVEYNKTVSKPTNPSKTGYNFVSWKNGTTVYDFNSKVTSDITLTAYFEKVTYKVTFMVDSTKVDEKTVEYNSTVAKPTDPTKSGYTFVSWKNGTATFDFSTKITGNITLTAEFTQNSNIVVTYDFGYTCYQTKNDLKVAYYTDFYNFLVSQNYSNWSTYNISNLNDFLTFMDTFKWGNKSEMQSIGNAFGSYYVKVDVGGKLEDQPETSFLGWCYKNNKYIDFIHHLETFFAYWRTDEGYSATDPNGNDFYASSWASMVDTAKFFYFNGDTLQTNFNGIYSWFDSERVQYALDHIPGVGRVTLTYTSESSITLPTDITRDGYTFAGWVDSNNNPVTVASKTMKVTAKWNQAEEQEDNLETLASEFLADYNSVTKLSLSDISNLDTNYLGANSMKTFGENETMLVKWMWLFKALADVNSNTNAYPDSNGFDWTDYRGFYLANICGFFTRTQHTDTWLKTVSADFSIASNVNAVLNYDKITVKFMDGDTVYKVEMIEKGSKVTRPTDPTKDGSTFDGWLNGTTAFDFNTTISSDLTLTAKYTTTSCTVTFKVDGSVYDTKTVSYNSTVTLPTNPTKTGYNFVGWMNGEDAFTSSSKVTSNLTVVASFEIKTFTVTFKVDSTVYDTKTVNYNETVTMPTNPTKSGYTFVSWKNGTADFVSSTKITSDLLLTAYFTSSQTGANVTYDFGYTCFQTKDDLRVAFYTDFYNFLVSKGHGTFTKTAGTNTVGSFTVTDVNTFIAFMDTWQIGDRKEMGFIGDELGSYYITKDAGGSLEDQPDTTFVGWCYKNGKYTEFLPHLIEFFAYWRTDEGYTTETNHGNDFFYDSWAAMVDTAKFFHFTSSTLRTKNNGMYSWFNSERVDYALDHIPGVGRVTLEYTNSSSITLPQDITRDGYTFTGWVDANGTAVTTVSSTMTVYATWQKAETLVYTIRAEATTNGLSGSETGWYCATPSQSSNGYLYGNRIILTANGSNYTVSQILSGDGTRPSDGYAYRIVNYDGSAYHEFDAAIKVGLKVTATVDGNYIVFNFYE